MFGDDSDHHRPNQTHPVDLGKTSVFLVSVASALFLFEDLLFVVPLKHHQKTGGYYTSKVQWLEPENDGFSKRASPFPGGKISGEAC